MLIFKIKKKPYIKVYAKLPEECNSPKKGDVLKEKDKINIQNKKTLIENWCKKHCINDYKMPSPLDKIEAAGIPVKFSCKNDATLFRLIWG